MKSFVTAIKKIRDFPPKINFRFEILFTLSVIILGLLFGYIAKAADSISIIGHIGTDLGVWIFTAALVAAFSRTPVSAVINTPVFFLSMLLSYYAYGQIVLGFFNEAYFTGWLVVALLSPAGGIVAWLSRGKGLISGICAAIPASVLLACGYPAFYTRNPVHILNLLFAVVLLIILTRTWKGRAAAAAAAALFGAVIFQLNLISLLPW